VSGGTDRYGRHDPLVTLHMRLHSSLRRTRRVIGRAVWTFADQGISSLATAVLSFVVARESTTNQYGVFALAFTIYSFCLGIGQAFAGQVFTIRYARDGAPSRDATGRTAGAAITAALACSAMLLLLAAFMTHELATTFLAFAALLPGLLLQDTWRTIFISRGSPQKAFFNDLTWTSLQVAAIVFLLWNGRVNGALPFILAWGLAAYSSDVVASVQSRTVPAFRGLKRAIVANWDLSSTLLLQWITVTGVAQATIILLAVVGSPETVGALRGAQTLLGPLSIVGLAASAFSTPELARRDLGPRGWLASAFAISSFIIAVNLCWGAVLLLLPDTAGVALLGATWPNTEQVLPAMILFSAAIAGGTGPSCVFRALDRTKNILISSLAFGPLFLALSIGGLLIAGARGASVGMAVAALLVLPLYWVLLFRSASAGRALAPYRTTGIHHAGIDSKSR
jgi:O-antigen/teichoic acid export membrane protein